MGCDIHGPYLETRALDDDFPRWYCQAKFHISRDYWLFALMANVRNHDNREGATFKGAPCFRPRGYPQDASYETDENFFYYVTDDEGVHYPQVCTKEYALERVAKGISFFKHNSPNFVSDPDAHSASWLTTQELETAYERYKAILLAEGDDQCYIKPIEALLAAMKSFETHPMVQCRIVFWFDN
jgi:hypothetical protein